MCLLYGQEPNENTRLNKIHAYIYISIIMTKTVLPRKIIGVFYFYTFRSVRRVHPPCDVDFSVVINCRPVGNHRKTGGDGMNGDKGMTSDGAIICIRIYYTHNPRP